MKFDDYRILAGRTDNRKLNAEERLINAALGLTGESGEFADMIKKMAFQGHSLDMDKMIEELGDILWYIAQACSALDVTMDEVASTNIKKLAKRYPEGFDAEKSINRREYVE